MDTFGTLPTPFLFVSQEPTPLERGQNVPSAYKQLSWKVGPSNPCNLPSEVGRESALNPGHLNLSSAGPGSGGAPRSPAGAAAGCAGALGRCAHVVAGRGTCGGDQRRREESAAPRGSGAPQRLGARGGEGTVPRRSGARRGEARRCQAGCSPRGGVRRKQDASLNGVATFFSFFFLFSFFKGSEQMRLNPILG